MTTILHTTVEADDNKIQSSVHYFSTFFIKNLFAGYSCKHQFSIIKLEHRHPEGSFFLYSFT